MKIFICLFLVGISISSQAQSIIGSWQLVKESSCMEESMMTATNDSTQRLVDDMKSMGHHASAQVVTFKEKLAGEESTRILNHKKSANSKGFLYKFDGESLLILDKKSHTITDNYMVDKFSSDSLIVSNSTRPCETKIFRRIK
jgi:hypothetical protein